jgi:acyl-CoA thioester hydrolase
VSAKAIANFLPDREEADHEMVIPVRWGDMDAMGHVNNTVYFRYIEIARLEWLFRVGGPPDPTGSGPVIVNAFCNFMRQLEFPGEVLARPLRGQPRPQQLRHLRHAGAADEPGVVYAEGGARRSGWTSRREVGAAAGLDARARRMSAARARSGAQQLLDQLGVVAAPCFFISRAR